MKLFIFSADSVWQAEHSVRMLQEQYKKITAELQQCDDPAGQQKLLRMATAMLRIIWEFKNQINDCHYAEKN